MNSHPLRCSISQRSKHELYKNPRFRTSLPMKFTDKQHMRQGGRHAGQRQQKAERRAKERSAGGRYGKGGGRRAGARAAEGGMIRAAAGMGRAAGGGMRPFVVWPGRVEPLPLRGCGVSRPELTAEGNRRGQNRLHSVDSAALATSRPEAFLGSAWPAARMLHCLQEKIMNRGDFVQPLCKPDTHPSSTRPKLIVRRNRRPPSPKTAKSPPASPVALLAVHHKAGVIQADHGR